MEAITPEEAEELHKEAWAKAKAKKAKAAEEAAKKKAAEEAAKKKAEREQYKNWKPGDPLVQAKSVGPKPETVTLLTESDQVSFLAGDQKKFSGYMLNDVPLRPVKPKPTFWETIPDNTLVGDTTPITGPSTSTGVVFVEPDGRLWIVEPTKHYGGYNYTYPKGGWKAGKGLTAQQKALKEAWEESGLYGTIEGWLGDFVSEKTGSVTRYYVGKRTGGAPWAFGSESQAVHLVTLEKAGTLLHTERDLKVLNDLVDHLGLTGKVKIPKIVPPAVKPKPSAPSKKPRPTPSPTAKPPQPTVIGPNVPPPQTVSGLREGVFPESIEGLQEVRSLGGSTGARLVKDPQTGRLYVLKRGASAAHIRSEALADELYQRLGIRVPSFQLYETATGPVKLAEYIPDTTLLSDVMGQASASKLRDAAVKQLQQDFYADAWLGNWDVLGTGFDNILIDKNGDTWRIDNGGALLFRAQGELKATGSFNPYLRELWSMRQRGYAGRLFGDMSWEQITAQLGRLSGYEVEELLAGVPDDVAAILRARQGTARHLWGLSNAMLTDSFEAAYVESLAEEVINLREAGFLDQLPSKLEQRMADSTTLYDVNGKVWDDLRGTDSAGVWLKRYMAEHGGDYSQVSSWMSGQAGSSWSGHPMTLKRWIAGKRTVDLDQYFWGTGGLEKATAQLAQYGTEVYENTFRIWHAANYELLSTVNMPYSDPGRGIAWIMRTVSNNRVQRAGLVKGEVGLFQQGANESGSIFRSVTVNGREMTLQAVPYHRVTGGYWWERQVGSGTGGFCSEGENEVTFMPQGLPTYLWGSTSSGVGARRFWTTKIMDMLLKQLLKGG